MSNHFDRALLLYQQQRFDMAETQLRQGLLADPDDPRCHSLLALCLCHREQFKEASESADTAVGLAPDLPFVHYVRARVLLMRNRPAEAKTAILESIRLAPEDADYFATLSEIELHRRDWAAALQAAEQGLEHDPENTDCANLRAMALVKMGRKQDAQLLIDSTLAREPEDEFAHANKGWALLHQGRPRDAMESFREALRLNPELDWARQGMVEALKARNPIYRVMLAYFLWMSTLSHKAQWGIILAIYFLPKMLRNMARDNPTMQIWVYPILAIVVLFAIMTWIADPLFNLLLRLSRFGRMVLSRDQILVSNALLVCFAGGLLALPVGYWIDPRAYIVTVMFLLMTIPISGTFRRPRGWPRTVLTIYTAVLVLLAIASLGLLFTATGTSDFRHSLAVAGLGLWLIATFVFSWVANILSMVTIKR